MHDGTQKSRPAQEDTAFPEKIRRCFDLAAKQLSDSLVKLEWPSNNLDAPAPERNVLFAFAHQLANLDEPFSLYFEGARGKGRIDAMACDGQFALAIEAKSMGKVNDQSISMINDLSLMRAGFSPKLADNLASGEKPRDWWNEARSRWGIILASSFVGEAIAVAWQAPDEVAFRECYKKNTHGGFLDLWREIRNVDRGVAEVDTSYWKGDHRAFILWAAVPLQKVEVAI